MKSLLTACCYLVLLAGITDCKKTPENPQSPEPLAIIETAIPNGLIPGSALTLKGKNFLTVTSVKLANTTVPASDFIRTAANELSFKVPLGTTAGKICVVNQNGQGTWKDMALISSGVLTADNVGTNVTTPVQGYNSDECTPDWFMYCLNSTTCLIYRRGTGLPPIGGPASATCTQYYSTTQLAGSSFEVYTHPKATLKFELKKNSKEYTGLVIMEISGVTYLGSMAKNSSGRIGSIVGYSVVDGTVQRLCNPNASSTTKLSGNPELRCNTAPFPCATCQ